MKQDSPRTSRDDGRKIDDSDLQFKNAESPIVRSLDPDPTVNWSIPWHSEKQPASSFSTDGGMQMDESEEQA
jgi:hypothetical protein